MRTCIMSDYPPNQVLSWRLSVKLVFRAHKTLVDIVDECKERKLENFKILPAKETFRPLKKG